MQCVGRWAQLPTSRNTIVPSKKKNRNLKKDRLELQYLQCGMCFWCRCERDHAEMQEIHLRSLGMGGARRSKQDSRNDVSNRRLACGMCPCCRTNCHDEWDKYYRAHKGEIDISALPWVLDR